MKSKTVNEPMAYVCADCGHHQNSMDRNCDICGGFRVVLVSVLIRLVGDDYMKHFGKDGDFQNKDNKP